MNPTWHSEDPPDPIDITALGWVRVLSRGIPLAIVVFGGLLIHLTLRLIEAPILGVHRPWTPWITQAVCRTAFRLLGMGFHTSGTVMASPGAVVANHSSWLDIFALNARKRIYFVSKAEVAAWPGIGWLARATGTLFIDRDPRKAKLHQKALQARLKDGQKLLFFPEGTSTDGRRVLPFRTTLFSAVFADGLHDTVSIQPVTVRYTAPPGAPDRFYAWWGAMGFGPHLLQVLAQAPQGQVEVAYLAPLKVSDFDDRKSLAGAAEDRVRQDLVTWLDAR